MYGKRKSKFVTALTVLLFLLLIALAVGAIVKFTKVGDKVVDIVNPVFRVELNGVSYTGNDNKIVLPDDGKVKFEIKCTNGFKVNVTPNVTDATNFTYTVNGQEYLYGDEDLSGIIVKNDDIYGDCFYIDCSQSFKLEDILSRVWGGEQVILNGAVTYPYLLTITSNSGEIVTIAIGRPEFVTDLTLSDSNILFGVMQNENDK